MNTPYIVAELGANHLKDYVRAVWSIQKAKECGADAVKLQCWTPGTMAANPDQVIESGPWKGKTLGQLYAQCETPWDWFPDLFSFGKNIGIEVFSSVFDSGALEFLESLGCPRYKISSFEATDLRLISACAATGKPLIISTGMASNTEIRDAVLAAGPKVDLTLLHCVSAYPAPIEDMNLETLKHLRGSFKVGLSDHSEGPVAAIIATLFGATLIEKHFTLSRYDGGPDASFSMEPREFADMVRWVRQAPLALGKPTYGPKPSEQYLHLRRGAKGRGS